MGFRPILIALLFLAAALFPSAFAGFSTPVTIIPAERWNDFPEIATAPDGTLYVTTKANLWRSTDGGGTFEMILGMEGPDGGYGSITVAPDGRVYFASIGYYGSWYGQLFVHTSADRGQTWSWNALGTDCADLGDLGSICLSPITFRTASVVAPNAQRAYVVALGGNNGVVIPDTTPTGPYETHEIVYLTNDAGTTWVPASASVKATTTVSGRPYAWDADRFMEPLALAATPCGFDYTLQPCSPDVAGSPFAAAFEGIQLYSTATGVTNQGIRPLASASIEGRPSAITAEWPPGCHPNCMGLVLAAEDLWGGYWDAYKAATPHTNLSLEWRALDPLGLVTASQSGRVWTGGVGDAVIASHNATRFGVLFTTFDIEPPAYRNNVTVKWAQTSNALDPTPIWTIQDTPALPNGSVAIGPDGRVHIVWLEGSAVKYIHD